MADGYTPGNGAVNGALTITGQIANAMQLVVKGAPGQSVDLQEWQNSVGSVAAGMTAGGTMFAVAVQTGGNKVALRENGANGFIDAVQGTAPPNPAASTVRLAVLPGTTGSKLVAIGPTGAQSVIADNIL